MAVKDRGVPESEMSHYERVVFGPKIERGKAWKESGYRGGSGLARGLREEAFYGIIFVVAN
jgi:hypothetical protein